MTRIFLVSSFMCAALIACGDKGANEDNTSKPGGDDVGASETGGGSTGPVDPSAGTSDPTTGTPPELTGGSEDTGVDSFILTPDGGTAGTFQCDVWKQDCMAGEKCAAWAEGGGSAWNATKCVAVTGTKVPGDVCSTEGGGVSGLDDCEAGAMCWDVNDQNEGVCVALCTGSEMQPQCDAGFSCLIANEGSLNLCLPGCDPLVQDCPGNNLCVPNNNEFLCVLDASGDGGKTNDPCEFGNACDKGLLCLNTSAASSACMQGSTGCCQPFCEFVQGQDGDCPNPDQKCVQWYDPMMEIPPGAEDIGVCAIPG